MADPHRLIIVEVQFQSRGDLLGTPRPHPPAITAVRLVASGPLPRFRAQYRCAVAPADLAAEPVLDILTQPRVGTSFAIFGRWATRSPFHCATEAR